MKLALLILSSLLVTFINSHPLEISRSKRGDNCGGSGSCNISIGNNNQGVQPCIPMPNGYIPKRYRTRGRGRDRNQNNCEGDNSCQITIGGYPGVQIYCDPEDEEENVNSAKELVDYESGKNKSTVWIGENKNKSTVRIGKLNNQEQF